jgi:hypothetical protein
VSRRLCDIFGSGPGNCTSGFGVVLTTRFHRAVVWHDGAVGRVAHAWHRDVVTTTPEIIMSLGTQAVVARNGPAGGGSLRRAADQVPFVSAPA